MLKHIIGYGSCVLVIIISLWLWHESDKEVNALENKLEQATLIIEEKDKEIKREQDATLRRDLAYEEQDKKLDDLTQRIRNLSRSNEALNRVLRMHLPPDATRVLRE